MNVTNTNMATYESLVNAFKKISGEDLSTENIKDVSVVTGETGLTITFNAVVDGKEVPIVLAMTPELDAPEGAADQVTVGELLSKLELTVPDGMTAEEAEAYKNEMVARLAEKIAEKGGLKTTQLPSTGSTGGSATLFNLLEILSLLVEVGQEIKKSAKSIKTADNEMQALNYERQADATLAMAEAAKAQGAKYLTISVVMMVASAVVSIGAGVYGATKEALPETKAAGVESTMAKTVQNMDVTAENVSTITTKPGNSAASALGEAKVNEIKSSFAEDRSINAAKQQCATAQNNVREASSTVNTARENLANATTARDEAQATLDTAQQNLDAAPPDAPNRVELQQAVDDAQADLDAKNDVVTQRTTELNNAKTTLSDAQNALGDAKAQYRDAVKNVMEKYESAYTGASNATKDEKFNELTVATELGMKMLKGGETGAPEGAGETILNDVDFGKVVSRARNNHTMAMRAESNWKMQAAAQIGQLGGQVSTALNQHWQAEVNYDAQAASAKAQKLQAEATRKQNDYDSDKSLEESGQQIIDAAQQTLRKVYDGEHETSRQIFS